MYFSMSKPRVTNYSTFYTYSSVLINFRRRIAWFVWGGWSGVNWCDYSEDLCQLVIVKHFDSSAELCKWRCDLQTLKQKTIVKTGARTPTDIWNCVWRTSLLWRRIRSFENLKTRQVSMAWLNWLMEWLHLLFFFHIRVKSGPRWNIYLGSGFSRFT